MKHDRFPLGPSEAGPEAHGRIPALDLMLDLLEFCARVGGQFLEGLEPLLQGGGVGARTGAGTRTCARGFCRVPGGYGKSCGYMDALVSFLLNWMRGTSSNFVGNSPGKSSVSISSVVDGVNCRLSCRDLVWGWLDFVALFN